MADNNAAGRARPVLIPPGLVPHILDYFSQMNPTASAAQVGPMAPAAGPAAGSPAAFGVGAGNPVSAETGNLLNATINGDLLNKSLQAAAKGQSKSNSPDSGILCPPVMPTDDPGLVRLANLRALALLNPKQDESKNVQPYTDNFSRVQDPAAVNTKGWNPAFSLHGSSIESPSLPSFPDYAAKMYKDPELGNTIAVTHPTDSVLHKLYALPYIFGAPVNAWFARDFLKGSAPMCGPTGR